MSSCPELTLRPSKVTIVPRFQTCFVRGSPGLDRFGVVLDDRPRARVARVDGDTKGGVLRLGAAPGVDDVVDHAFGVGGRDREPKADVALGFTHEVVHRDDHRVDPDDPTSDIHQGATGVSGVDGGNGLNGVELTGAFSTVLLRGDTRPVSGADVY